MDCQRCGREATIHEITLVDGVVTEHHLCESCAADQGFEIHPHAPIGALTRRPATDSVREPGCPSCGMTWEVFRSGGHVGCQGCYEAFVDRLAPLIERAHDGATHHVGKTPKRAGAQRPETAANAETISARISEVRKQLDQAVRGEQYERAAILRDELDALLQTPPPSSRGGVG